MLLRCGVLLVLCLGAGAQDRTVLEIALDVARRDHPDLDASVVGAAIGKLADRYTTLVAGSTEPAVRADAFRRMLFGEFEAVAELDSAKHLHLDTVLRSRKGYCLSLSIVALAVAERVGAPLFGVAMPNHFLVRYDDGKFRRNLELTRRGAAVTDETLRERLGRVGKDTAYLRNLKPAEVEAYLLHNRGYVALLRKRHGRARADFEAAIEIQPGFGEAHRNLGVVLGEKRKWDAAKRAFGKAIAINPGDVNALVNMAICRHRLGDREAAIQDLEMALALEPERVRAEALLRKWRAEKSTAPARVDALPEPPPNLKPGLRARYYAGTSFEKLAIERVDQELDFNWNNDTPAAKVPRDRFSVRWEGFFKAPRAGTYTFFVVANDGARVTVGRTKVLENWRNMGFKNWYGTKDIELAAGWHPIRIEHYDIVGGARLLVRVGIDDREQPLDLSKHLFHTKR